MLNEAQLVSLLRSSETHWVERKKSFHHSDIQKTIVGFANSVPEDQDAVLFIGIGPDGVFEPVPNPDEMQRKIRRLAEEQCFPSIRCSPAVVRDGGSEIIAVVVEFSPYRPHFAGHAFIRVGSETKKASQEMFDELIASRNDKTRRILRDKGQIVTTVWKTARDPSSVRREISRAQRAGIQPTTAPHLWDLENTRESRVEYCDAHYVQFSDPTTRELYSAPLNKVQIDFDAVHARTKLIIDNR